MVLTSKTVRLIVVLVVVALGGLVTLQVLLLDYAMTLKEQAFRRNVMAALGQISHGLATQEAMTVVLEFDSTDQVTCETHFGAVAAPAKHGIRRRTKDIIVDCADSSLVPPFRTEGERIQYTLRQPQHVMIRLFDPTTGMDTVYVDSFQQAGQHEVMMVEKYFSDTAVFLEFATDSVTRFLRFAAGGPAPVGQDDSTGAGKLGMITAVYKNLVESEFAPIEERLDSINIDSVIAVTLAENGIDLSYAYGVTTPRDDSLRLISLAVYKNEVKQSDFNIRLFPQDIFAPPSYLSFYFPERRAYLWWEMGPLILATVILMLVITACFVYTIRTIVRQERFSKLMIDFINNMTHEFKTPISTIALATEAICRPDVVEEPDRVLHFNAMIENENRRMRSQTEKILQMAVLEEKDFELNLSDFDVHQVVQSAIDSTTLQVQNLKGQLTCRLEATRSTIKADKIHLTNIIHNLLDNAMKYSKDVPNISVRTFDSNDGLGIRIEDCGIGLKPDDRKRVFEKYYRVPTGNRHDVKGFGLGLSYVKMMVEAHGGTIALYSQYGEGTQVELVFPVEAGGEGR